MNKTTMNVIMVAGGAIAGYFITDMILKRTRKGSSEDSANFIDEPVLYVDDFCKNVGLYTQGSVTSCQDYCENVDGGVWDASTSTCNPSIQGSNQNLGSIRGRSVKGRSATTSRKSLDRFMNMGHK